MKKPKNYRSTNLFIQLKIAAMVTTRRLQNGPFLLSWNWTIEFGTEFLRHQGKLAYAIDDIYESRRFMDSATLASPYLNRVVVTPNLDPVKGDWYQEKESFHARTLLYLHGGGYAYYPRFYRNLIALFAVNAQAKTFALDYRLIPENPFPSQLEDAMIAYQWLINHGGINDILIGGDSAGGNLVLALLLKIRDMRLPQPRMAFCISPWVDVANPGNSLFNNAKSDWVIPEIVEVWSQWLCAQEERENPLISPQYADMDGLPFIYIQAGKAECLYDQIERFSLTAAERGGDVLFEAWDEMNHDFQAYGNQTRASREALERLRLIINERMPADDRSITSP